MTAASDRQCPPVARQLSGRRQISLGGGLPSHRLRYISGPTIFNLYFSIFPNIFMFSLKFLPLNIIIIPSHRLKIHRWSNHFLSSLPIGYHYHCSPSHWTHFAQIVTKLQTTWHHFETAWTTFGRHLGTSWKTLGITWRQLLYNFDTNYDKFESVWDQFWTVLKQLLDFWQVLWDIFGTTLRKNWQNPETTLQQLLHKSKTILWQL